MREATVVVVFLFLLFTTSTLLPATSAQPPLQPAGCVDELVAFSPCLSYVSAPPNNVTETAASQCCDAFSSVLDSGDATGHHHSSARPDNVKAPSKSSPAQPARNSPPKISTPAQPARNSPPTSSSLPGNSVRSPTTPSSSVQLVRGSFTTTQIFNCSWFLPGMLIFALVFIHV
ncbi:hypothetical protein Dsin_029648 [Dipteronia sinensis]|uniref:Bifunctional inhibitor/plant lipid transfer protein/seed storage helical domain-containing protein n=1 Tax=Dipteronia sinensis TaxID=43782 RepID=A0AAD9ZU38_9ROSI|nr:hypothetical protein Dsin_029648 [Dipteronia sinensis]